MQAWRTETRFADSIISELLAKQNSPSDRALRSNCFTASCAILALLDFWIDCLRASRVDDRSSRYSATRLISTLLSQNAGACSSPRNSGARAERARTIINAMLRAAHAAAKRFARRRQEQPLFIRTSHPQFLVERWQEHFGTEHAEKLCEWNNLPAPVYAGLTGLVQASATILPALFSRAGP